MLRTLLTWHATATALLLAAYVLVAGLQWSAARVSHVVVRVRHQAADRARVPEAAAGRDEAAAVTLGGAA